MSRLQGKPYAQKVVESLDATERTDLLGLLNGSSITPAFRSLTNASAYITDADEGVSHVSLETADGNLTGYLAYTDDYVTLFAYERNSQGIAQYELDLDAMTISEVRENLDIEGLRTIVTDSLKADLVGGKVPAEQLPSYVDDVVEYEDLAHFPAEGEYGKIYIALDTGSTYRWGGTEYVQIGGSSATPMVSITWSELKTLRDGGSLLPGQQYRITDYGFTTVTSGTSSAGHVFDIIVTAEDESHLEEEAFAAHHAGDTYFASNKLEAWRLWYALDNDTDRFEWADATNGKGVIYRMIDEFGNDVPYDFKNCLIGSSNYYTFTETVTQSGNAVADASLRSDSNNKVYNNVMGKYVSNGKQSLNKNYFRYSSDDLRAYDNVFGEGCYDNKLNGDCHHNVFGNDCANNTLGNNCRYNILQDKCSSNTLNGGDQRNTFGIESTSNNLANGCEDNVFGIKSENNRLKGNSKNNVFGEECTQNKLGDGARGNTFGNYAKQITLGRYTLGCSFGNYCQSIQIVTNENNDAYAKNLIFDPGVVYVNITSADDANMSSSNQLQNIHVHSGISGDSNTPKSIVVPERGQSYSYDYYAANSVDVMI